MHVIVNSQGTGTTPVLNQNGPLTYSRSTDGGLTWIDDHIQIPGTNASFMSGIGADEYHIDVRGDVVAVVTGGFINDVSLFKSVDGGLSWTKTVVMAFPLGQPYDPTTMNTDTTGDGIGELLETNAGDVTVTIDNNNVCHVAFGHMFVSEDAGATSESYFPSDNTGLYYWHEGMTVPVIVTAAEDFNGNGFIDIPIPSDTLNDVGYGLYSIGLVGQPSIGIANNNSVYIAYSAIDERADTSVWQEAFRHIFVIASGNAGLTWTVPYTLNPSPDGDFQEAVWPSMASLVDSCMHIVYQRDPAPGHSLSTNATQAANNLLSPSDIIYAKTSVNVLSATNSIYGNCFVDLNQNGIKDLNENGYHNLRVVSTGSSYVHSSQPDNNGNFYNYTDTGNIITTLQNLQYYTYSPLQHNSYFATYNGSDSINFALVPIPGIQDLTLSLFPLNAARPGFDATYRIVYNNIGTVSMSGSIYLVRDSAQTYLTSTVPLTGVSGDTLEFTYSNLAPAETRHIDIVFHIASPPVVNFGDVLTLLAFISPLPTDTNVEDNSMLINQTVIGSYDPNDKAMLGGTYITPTQVANEEFMHYMIRFQNTGTDTAFTVIVRDTLSANLDWNSMEMESASHSYNLTIADGNILKWQFNNINLADSNVNESASHGYIAYKVKPLNTLALGSVILNTAYIYFDFNLPVLTNAAYTVVGVVGINENSGGGLHANIYPNPNTGTFNIDLINFQNDVEIKVCNVFGQVISHRYLKSVNHVAEKIEGSNGLYFVYVKSDRGSIVLRVIKQ